MTREELIAQLNDPALLEEAAAKLGMKVSKEVKPAKRELPKFDIPEDAELPAIVKALNTGLNSFVSFMQGSMEDTRGEVTNRITEDKKASVASEVKAFAKKHPDFEQLVKFVEPYWKAGETLDEAYKLGKAAAVGSGWKPAKAKGADEETVDESGKPVVKKVNRSIRTDEGSEIEQSETRKPTRTVKDAAKQNLDALLAEEEHEGALDEDNKDEIK